jgi:hypothetical protein
MNTEINNNELTSVTEVKWSKEETVQNLNKLHKLSANKSKYENLLKEVPEKKDDISGWIDEAKTEIETLKEVLKEFIPKFYGNEVLDKCFIRRTEDKYHITLQLMNVKKIGHLSYTPYREDVAYGPEGEYLYIQMPLNGKFVNEIRYMKEVTVYDRCPGYLNSNSFFADEGGLNGWQLIDFQTYENLVNPYRNDTPAVSVDEIKNIKAYDVEN